MPRSNGKADDGLVKAGDDLRGWQVVRGQFVPHYPLTDDGRTGIHQAFTIGRVRVIMTDSRSQRASSRRAPRWSSG